MEISLVTGRDVIYFHILYYLVALTTRREVNSFSSPSSISFRLNKTIVILGYLSGFHFIVDSFLELSIIHPVLMILSFYCFPFSSIVIVHTFLQGWINPGCFVQFITSSLKRSRWVNNAYFVLQLGQIEQMRHQKPFRGRHQVTNLTLCGQDDITIVLIA